MNTMYRTRIKKTDKHLDKVFKNRPSEICGKQPLKILKGYGLR